MLNELNNYWRDLLRQLILQVALEIAILDAEKKRAPCPQCLHVTSNMHPLPSSAFFHKHPWTADSVSAGVDVNKHACPPNPTHPRQCRLGLLSTLPI